MLTRKLLIAGAVLSVTSVFAGPLPVEDEGYVAEGDAFAYVEAVVDARIAPCSTEGSTVSVDSLAAFGLGAVEVADADPALITVCGGEPMVYEDR